MAVTLEITFVGLVAFAEDAKDEKLFALLPATGSASSAGVHKHDASLKYDDAQVESEGKADVEAAQQEGKAKAVADTPEFLPLPLGGKRMSFPNLSGTGSKITPPDTAAPLMDYGKGPLDRQQVGPSPRDSVHALIELPGADAILPGARTARWRVGLNGTKKHYLSHALIWKREIPEDSVCIEIKDMNGGGETTHLTLTGEDGDTIELYICHVPDSSNDHDVNHNDPAHHFKAYHALYENPAGELPYLDQKPGRARRSRDEEETKRGRVGANVFSCMTAKVPVEP